MHTHPIQKIIKPAMVIVFLNSTLGGQFTCHASERVYSARKPPPNALEKSTLENQPPILASWIKERRSLLDRWINENDEQHTSRAGWPHSNVDAATGLFKKWAPFDKKKARKSSGSSNDDAAQLSLIRIYNIDRLKDAAYIYKTYREPKYAKWVIQQVSLYADAYKSLLDGKSNSAFFANSLDEAVAATTLAEAAWIVLDQCREPEKNAWRDKLFAPLSESLLKARSGQSNITFWQSSAAASIALRFGFASTFTSAIDGKLGLRELLKTGVTPDGFWHESSLHYHYYVLEALSRVLAAAYDTKNQSSSLPELHAALVVMLNSPMSLRFKNGDAPIFNDGNPLQRIPPPNIIASTRRFADSYFSREDIKSAPNWDLVIDMNIQSGSKSVIDSAGKSPTGNVPGMNAVKIASGDWEGILKYGQRDKGHAQPESLAIELMYGDQWIFRDSGSSPYGSPLQKGFFRTPFAQSVPLINRAGQYEWPSLGEFIGIGSKQDSAEVAHNNYRPGQRVNRKITIGAQGLIDIVSVSSSKKLPDKLGLMYHTRCSVKLLDPVKNDSNTLSFKPNDFFNPIASRCDGNTAVSLVCGAHQFKMNFQGSVSRGCSTIYTVPDSIPPGKRTAIYFEVDNSSTISVQVQAASTSKEQVFK